MDDKKQPHADRLKLFDNLDKAKVEAEAIFKRVREAQTGNGLPGSKLDQAKQENLIWDEANILNYFF